MTENNELTVHETHDVFESYDLADEEQIIAEMSGRVADKYVYTFKQGGQDVTGLSFAGTNWAVREYAKQGEVIRIVGRPDVIEEDDYVKIMVTAQRFAINRETGKEIALDNTVQGKRQAKFMEKKKYGPDGELVGREQIPDPFYFEKGLSKAIRNAKQALIPTDIVKKLISRALDSRNGKNVPPKGQQQQQRPPQQERPPQNPQGQTQQTQQARPIQSPPAGPPQQQRPPQQQQAPPPPPPQQQQAPPPPPPQQQAPPPPPPPQQQQAPPPPPPQRQPPPPQQQQAPSQDMPKDVMVQKLDAVLKVVFNTQDSAGARAGLQTLTGFASPADMPVDKIKMLGNTLNAVVKKQARIETNRVIRIQDNVVLWQGPEVAGVAPGTEPMF